MLAARPTPGGGYDLVARGEDNAVWHCHADTLETLGMAGWESLGGETHQQPGILWNADGSECMAVCVGVDDVLYRKLWQAVPFKWQPTWTPMAGKSPSTAT